MADDPIPSGSTDGHGVLGSPIIAHSPHPIHSHPAQPAISASSSNSPNIAIPSRPSLSSKSSSSPPRSSTEVDLTAKPPSSATTRWRNSLPPGMQRADVTSGLGAPQRDTNTVVEPGFDESVLRALCDLDVSSRVSSPGTDLLSPSFPPPP